MVWNNGESLAKITIDLENTEQRFAAGERSDALHQAAQKIYVWAVESNNEAQRLWRDEIMDRAKKIMNDCQ